MITGRYTSIALLLLLPACSHSAPSPLHTFEKPEPMQPVVPVVYDSKGDWSLVLPARFTQLKYETDELIACDTSLTDVCVKFEYYRTAYDPEEFASQLMFAAALGNYQDIRTVNWVGRDAIFIQFKTGNRDVYSWNALDKNGHAHTLFCAGSNNVKWQCDDIAKSVRF